MDGWDTPEYPGAEASADAKALLQARALSFPFKCAALAVPLQQVSPACWQGWLSATVNLLSHAAACSANAASHTAPAAAKAFAAA